MSIYVALHHVTHYKYDRPIDLGPQTIRLRPAPHTRTPILSYSLKVTPSNHFVNWQQDPQGNWLARYVFPEKATELKFEVDFTAQMTTVNPFDFFVEPYADSFPFEYTKDLKTELAPYLETIKPDPAFAKYLASIPREAPNTVNFLVDLNRELQQKINYVIRMEPGVQTPEETLTSCAGSCRDSAWLLIQTFRHLGLAARFVSGYLIQIRPDIDPIEGPPEVENDFTDLHAWAEVYLPGAGWIGFDATSGMLAGEGHIPVAATPHYRSAAPISGGSRTRPRSSFAFDMRVEPRPTSAPRVTAPFSDDAWERLDALGAVRSMPISWRNDVRLTMGGEPTFISIDDLRSGEEWNSGSRRADEARRAPTMLIRRLREALRPRRTSCITARANGIRARACRAGPSPLYWRKDGVPIWKATKTSSPRIDRSRNYAPSDRRTAEGARRHRRRRRLGQRFRLHSRLRGHRRYWVLKEAELPVNVDPLRFRIARRMPEERARIARVFEERPAQRRPAMCCRSSAGTRRPRSFLRDDRHALVELRRIADGPVPRCRGWRLAPLGLRLPLELAQGFSYRPAAGASPAYVVGAADPMVCGPTGQRPPGDRGPHRSAHFPERPSAPPELEAEPPARSRC